MGASIVSVRLDDETVVHAEATDANVEISEAELQGRAGLPNPETIKELIEKTAKVILDAIEFARPEEASAEFAIGVSGEASVPFLAKGKAEASITVTLTWKRDSATPPAPPAP